MNYRVRAGASSKAWCHTWRSIAREARPLCCPSPARHTGEAKALLHKVHAVFVYVGRLMGYTLKIGTASQNLIINVLLRYANAYGVIDGIFVGLFSLYIICL
jgi:hypothetical protein